MNRIELIKKIVEKRKAKKQVSFSQFMKALEERTSDKNIFEKLKA